MKLRELLGRGAIFLYMLLFVMTLSAEASAPYDAQKKVVITLQLEDLGSPREGTVFSIYQVGKVVEGDHLVYSPTDEFINSGVDLSDLSQRDKQQQVIDAALTQLPPQATKTATAQADGIVVFPALEQGVYLVCQTETADYGVVDPFIVALPYTDESGSEWNYDIAVSTKAEILRADLEVLKVDAEGNPLAGAGLALYDAAGKQLSAWETDGTAKKFDGLAVRGETYTVKEEKAPDGYLYAPDSVFTVGGTDSNVTITMVDKKGSPNYSLAVTKYVRDEERYRSVNRSFYAALFWDEQCTRRATDVLEIKLEKSYCGTAVFENLTDGTFYLAETDQTGNVLDSSLAAQPFTNEISNRAITLTAEQPTAASVIINHYKSADDDLLEDDAVITINKRVMAGTSPLEVTDAFYFTLYSNKELTNVVTTGTLELKQQSTGEVNFAGLAYGRYYIAESNAEGKPVDENFSYTVAVSEESVQVSDIAKQAEVDIVNDRSDEPEPPITEPEDPDPDDPNPKDPDPKDPDSKPDPKPQKGNGNGGRKKIVTTGTRVSRSAKTGDYTNILPYVIGLGIAGIAIVVLSRRRRRNE